MKKTTKTWNNKTIKYSRTRSQERSKNTQSYWAPDSCQSSEKPSRSGSWERRVKCGTCESSCHCYVAPETRAGLSLYSSLWSLLLRQPPLEGSLERRRRTWLAKSRRTTTVPAGQSLRLRSPVFPTGLRAISGRVGSGAHTILGAGAMAELWGWKRQCEKDSDASSQIKPQDHIHEEL